MIKDKLIDGQKLWAYLRVNSWRWLEILVVISRKIRQILLHWGYELTGKNFLLMSWQINV